MSDKYNDDFPDLLRDEGSDTYDEFGSFDTLDELDDLENDLRDNTDKDTRNDIQPSRVSRQKGKEYFDMLESISEGEDDNDSSPVVNTDPDTVSEEGLRQERAKINFSSLHVSDDVDDDSDINEIMVKQSFSNQRIISNSQNLPSGVLLVNDASDDNTKSKPNTDPGDNNRMRALFAFGSLLIAILVAGVVWASWYRPAPVTNDVALHGQSEIGNGKVINGGSSDKKNNQDDGSGSNATDDVKVPKNGSLVRYEITTEGDIKAVSMAYISGNGNQNSSTGVTSFPWKHSVGMRESVNPQLAANSTGYGTLTCTITQDGKKVAEKTVSGDKPSVECKL